MCPIVVLQTLADGACDHPAILAETIVLITCIMNMVVGWCGHMGCSLQECKHEGWTSNPPFPTATCFCARLLMEITSCYKR